MPKNEPERFRLIGVSREDAERLEYLRAEFKKNYNHYLKVIRETGVLSKHVLEKKTAKTSKRKRVGYPIETDILANTRQCARDKAVECVRLYQSLRRQNIRTELPEFIHGDVNPRLNWRDGYRIGADGSVRISVKKGCCVNAMLDGGGSALDRRFGYAELAKDDGNYVLEVNLLPPVGCVT
jgi:hypothetical protein